MLEVGKTYRWVTTPNDSLLIAMSDVSKDRNTSHASMAKRMKLSGRILGGFLRMTQDEELIFAGASRTVEAGNAVTLERALERGVGYVD